MKVLSFLAGAILTSICFVTLLNQENHEELQQTVGIPSPPVHVARRVQETESNLTAHPRDEHTTVSATPTAQYNDLSGELAQLQAENDKLRTELEPIRRKAAFLDEFAPTKKLLRRNDHRERLWASVERLAELIGDGDIKEGITAYRSVHQLNSAGAGTREDLIAALGAERVSRIESLLRDAPAFPQIGTPQEYEYYRWFAQRGLQDLQPFHLHLLGVLPPLALAQSKEQRQAEAEAQLEN